MNVVALCALLAAAPPLGGTSEPVFSRPEPQLARGAALLRQGDAAGALESFRRATGKSANERAIIEYDVGQALVLQAQQDAQAAPEADGGPPKVDVANARAAFERAAGLAADPALRSEAQLASGNAAALGGDVDAAIAAFRKALVADPKNERAKKNLLRALAAKKAQPPPPPNEGGENQDEQQGDEKKEEEQKDGEKKDEQKDGEKKDEQKDGEKKDGEKKDEKKDGEKKDEKDEQKDEQKGEKEDDKKDEQGPGGAQPQPKVQRKEDAKKLLDALRSREKPLTPLEMRGTAKTRPKAGKDW